MHPDDRQLEWIRPPQQARSQETLMRLLDAAELLVAEKGFEDTTVAEIARRAGSSVGAFYSRFRDKDGVLHALYERYLEEAVATADAALDPARWVGAGVSDVLGAVVRFLVGIYRERSGLIRAFALRNHMDPEFRARRERLSHYVAARLEALLLVRREEIRHPDPGRAVRFGLLMVFGTLENAALFGELRAADLTLSDDELSSELVRAYLHYLGIEEKTA
jgi:AcrR family transcriptional regulator